MSDKLDQTMDAAIKWLNDAWKEGLKARSDLSTYVNLETPDAIVPETAFVQRTKVANTQLTVEIAVASPVLEFSHSLTGLDVGDLGRQTGGLKKVVKDFGSDCRVRESMAVLTWIEGEVFQTRRDLLNDPGDELGRLLALDVRDNTAAVSVFFLTVAPETTHGEPPLDPLTDQRLAEAAGERGRNLRLLVHPRWVRTIDELKFVEKVVALPEGWRGSTMLLSIAGGPSVRRLSKEPTLTWSRDDDEIALSWTDRFMIDNADDAQLFTHYVP